MTKEKPFVQIIIVTWNKKNDVLRLLNELQKLYYPPGRYAIVVVDNNSDDGTIHSIEKNFPDVDTIQNHANLGGSGGFNSGMRWAMEKQPNPDYLWLLDNDVQVDPNALSALVHVLETDPDAGMCGSKILNSENHDDFIELGAFIDYRKGCVKRNSPANAGMANPEAVFSVDYVAACSLLVRSTIVTQIGLWHENFFISLRDLLKIINVYVYEIFPFSFLYLYSQQKNGGNYVFSVQKHCIFPSDNITGADPAFRPGILFPAPFLCCLFVCVQEDVPGCLYQQVCPRYIPRPKGLLLQVSSASGPGFHGRSTILLR